MLFTLAQIMLFPWLALLFRTRIHGIKPKTKGPIIIAANHMSRMDGMFLSHLFTPRKLKFMANRTIFNNPLQGFFSRMMGMYPAVGYGSSLELLEKGETLAIFPEGRISKDGIKAFQPGIIVLAIESGTPVYPVRINIPSSPFKRATATFGDPVCFEKPDHALTPTLLREKAEELRQIIISL